MEKKNKYFLKYLLIAILTITPLLFFHLYTLDKIRKLNALKNDKIAMLKDKQDVLEAKRVELQKLISEDEIIKKAYKKLGLIKTNDINKLTVNKSKLSLIKNLVDKIYD
ncbi:hypothetical protein BMS3Abin04_02383 [bacterium BMS3Abin04]|nr:hypothetical protein BMS3Abin04_02383 [bacterium BMS3Abin04]